MLYTSAQLDTLSERLPESIQETLSSGEVSQAVEKAKGLFSLSDAQAQALSLEIFDLLTGVSHVKDFLERIKIACGTSEELANRIIENLYPELFDTIAEDIGEAYLIREAYDKELEGKEVAEVVETRTATQTVALAHEHQMGLSKDDPLVVKAVQTIGKNYTLHVDQTGMLLNEIGLVFNGELSPKDFVANITARLAISHNLATHIAKDINDQVFEPIRQQLVDIYEKGKEQKKLGGSSDENVGYIVDLDTEDRMRIVDGKLQAMPKKDSGGISFIPSKLKTILDAEYSTKKQSLLEKIYPSSWETGGNPSGGSLLAAQQIASQGTNTKEGLGLEDSMIFHGMPTEDQLVSIKQKEVELEEKFSPTPVPQKISANAEITPIIPVPEKTKPSEGMVIAPKVSLSDAVKSYSLDPYREAVE